ncbi:ABC transporter ATP-binding protein [Methanogenium organophilum]|uniref:Cobalamin import ATP-binding protein BtuD n=1 Tax=Methanogenium organophilum TaxID=2199 RepID=A0A9X9T6C7_METOG|nr:ABC transporter ATP-binding protein [Methanogenium organophilum]WAI00263.1 ABC transporter ATP-binding protein [Methanogenium organophilum]
MVAITVKGLSYTYRKKPVFSGVSFEAKEGEVLGVVGPNGSGKTTIIKCIDGILQPKGEVRVFGEDVASMDRMSIARKIAYVPQSFPEGLSSVVYETIMMGRRPYLNWKTGLEDEEKVYHAMKMLGVEDFAFRKVKELSGGERQRVMIARAIVQETPVILMDEPTSSLDVRHQMEVMEVARGLAENRNIAVVMSLHDLNLAARYCDRIVVLNEGNLCGYGAPREVLTEDVIRQVYGIEARISSDVECPYIIPLHPVAGLQKGE